MSLMVAESERMAKRTRMALVLRPCGCRFGISDGYFPGVIEGVCRCDCCGKAEEYITVDRTPPWQRGRKKPKEEKVRVCADCLRDWKGIERKDAEGK